MVARANRALVLVHLLLALVALVAALVSLVMYSRVDRASDDGLSGFLVVYGVGGLMFAAVVGVLGVLALRAPSLPQAAAYSLPLGIVVLFLALVPALVGLAAEWWWQLGSVVVLLAPLALVVTSSLGMRRPTPT